jgi:hypothetical protein
MRMESNEEKKDGPDPVRCPSPRDAPECEKGGGGDVSRALGADVEIDNDCVMCMDAVKSHAFVPCGHVCVCARDALARLWGRTKSALSVAPLPLLSCASSYC